MGAVTNDYVNLAEKQVLSTYGDRVSVVQKGKSLLKFGRTEEVTTVNRTVAQLGNGESHETYVNTNAITHISSSEAADDQTVNIEYHTIADGVFTFGVQQVTLNGETAVALPVPCARVSRAYNTGSTDFAGYIYVFEDDTLTGGVPQTASKVHLVIPAEKNQTYKAATTVSNSDYLFITQVFASVNKKVAANVDVEIEIRLAGGVFRQQFPISVSTDGTTSVPPIDIRPFLVIPKNADVRMTAISLASSGIAVSAGFNSLLAAVIE